MITLDDLEKLLAAPAEDEKLEFKEARSRFECPKLLKYYAAIASEEGGHLILGVTDAVPRKVVGTEAFGSVGKLNDIKRRVNEVFGLRVDVSEIIHPNGRVLVFKIPRHPIGQPLRYKGYWMRSGESLVPMTSDRLKEIFAEDAQDWLLQTAKENIDGNDVIDLLDTEIYFQLLGRRYPSQQSEVLRSLEHEQFIIKDARKWSITNLGAIVLAKDLGRISFEVARKAPRIIIYEGKGKFHTKSEMDEERGYAVNFERWVKFAHESAPRNRILEKVVRTEQKMFPERALRELIANALIHQDFSIRGRVMVEMYEDRVEISNPGNSVIEVTRLIDRNKSRNENLAGVMRRFGFCEEKGSGIDKVILEIEVAQLPAPDFRSGDEHMISILYALRDFSEMGKADRIRACYYHCCLYYVMGQFMTNATLRDRFDLPPNKSSSITQIIKATMNMKDDMNLQEGWIKLDRQTSASPRDRRYVPFWA